jgi:predicted restriction endonuclease
MRRKQARILNYIEPRVSYNHGKSFGLAKFRKLTLKKDNNQCKNCFNAVKDMYRSREVINEAHHIIPRHHGGRNTISNGITLCTFCHDYFDMMYFKHGLDYYEVIMKKTAEKRIKEVRDLMEKHYVRYLLSIILSWLNP